MRKRNFNKNKSRKISGVISVSLEETKGNSEALVRRFIKKVKKEGIVDEFRSRTHFKKKSDRDREKRNEVRRRIVKENKQKEELFNNSAKGQKRSPRRNNRR
tara:strand:- start:2066 stop:2371 length:306 start_codon:yes stop_codon:yes gene_type:complete